MSETQKLSKFRMIGGKTIEELDAFFLQNFSRDGSLLTAWVNYKDFDPDTKEDEYGSLFRKYIRDKPYMFNGEIIFDATESIYVGKTKRANDFVFLFKSEFKVLGDQSSRAWHKTHFRKYDFDGEYTHMEYRDNFSRRFSKEYKLDPNEILKIFTSDDVKEEIEDNFLLMDYQRMPKFYDEHEFKVQDDPSKTRILKTNRLYKYYGDHTKDDVRIFLIDIKEQYYNRAYDKYWDYECFVIMNDVETALKETEESEGGGWRNIYFYRLEPYYIGEEVPMPELSPEWKKKIDNYRKQYRENDMVEDEPNEDLNNFPLVPKEKENINLIPKKSGSITYQLTPSKKECREGTIHSKVCIGDKIQLTNQAKENYGEKYDGIYEINLIASNTDEHRGYDESVSPMLLVDCKELNFALYEYEFQIVDSNEKEDNRAIIDEIIDTLGNCLALRRDHLYNKVIIEAGKEMSSLKFDRINRSESILFDNFVNFNLLIKGENFASLKLETYEGGIKGYQFEYDSEKIKNLIKDKKRSELEQILLRIQSFDGNYKTERSTLIELILIGLESYLKLQKKLIEKKIQNLTQKEFENRVDIELNVFDFWVRDLFDIDDSKFASVHYILETPQPKFSFVLNREKIKNFIIGSHLSDLKKNLEKINDTLDEAQRTHINENYDLTPEDLQKQGISSEDYQEAGEICVKFLESINFKGDIVEMTTKILDHQRPKEKFSETMKRIS